MASATDEVANGHDLRAVTRTQGVTNMNRAGAEVRRLLLRYFRNREKGAITIAQTPNFALVVFLVSTAAPPAKKVNHEMAPERFSCRLRPKWRREPSLPQIETSVRQSTV